MKNIAILAIAGLATAATAQGVTLTYDADGDGVGGNVVTADGNASWTVWASFSGYADSSAYFGGFLGSFNGNGSGAASNAMSLMAGNGTTPTTSGADINTINMFHSALLGTDDQSNPIAIFSFDTSGTVIGDDLSYGATGTASMFADDGIFSLPEEFVNGDINIISDTVSVVPAPGAMALLGLGGLAAARRRR